MAAIIHLVDFACRCIVAHGLLSRSYRSEIGLSSCTSGDNLRTYKHV